MIGQISKPLLRFRRPVLRLCNLVPNPISSMNEKGLPIFAFWLTSINTTTLGCA